MIVSVHLADVGVRSLPRLLRARLGDVPGLAYAEPSFAVPLGGRVFPPPVPRRFGLIAAWEDDPALDAFLAGHPLAARLAEAGGWHVRLAATRVFGAWPELPWLPRTEEKMDPDEPAVVLTLGRLKLPRAVPFLRASRAAEKLAVSDPAMTFSTALAGPPRFVSTFSMWRTVREMRDYSTGRHAPGHRDAMKAHAAKPFHHESAFVRFRQYAESGALA